MTEFIGSPNEAWLYQQIVEKWGAYGAHAEVYRIMAAQIGLQFDEWDPSD